MRSLSKVLTLFGLAGAVLIFACLVKYGRSSAEPGDVQVLEKLPPPKVVKSVEPPPPLPPTRDDVYRELRATLSDAWPEMEDWKLYDPGEGIMRLSKKLDTDPVIMTHEVAELANTVIELQPLFLRDREGGFHRALNIAWDTYLGAREVRDLSCHEISESDFGDEVGVKTGKQVQRVNPYHLIAMGYRESRLMKRTEVGYLLDRRTGKKNKNCRWCRGAAGERGMFQFMPKGFIQRRFMPKGCSPFDRMCSVRGAAKALAHIRCMCIEEFGDECNTDVYIAGYGLTRLPSPARARHSRGPKKARAFLCSVRDDCDDLWERAHSDDFAATL